MESDATGLLKIMAENNAKANALLTKASKLEESVKTDTLNDAVDACKKCGSAIDQYVTLDISSAKLIKVIDAAAVSTYKDTSIGCQACIDLGIYTQCLIQQQEIEAKQRAIEIKYMPQSS
jgi:hypothetical protein